MNRHNLILDIVDDNIEYYRIVPNQKFFCTMWDTNSVDITCNRPESEIGSDLVIQFYDIRKQLLVSLPVDERGKLPEFSITQRITQFPFIYISCYFKNKDANYIKNSELIRMELSCGTKPMALTPESPLAEMYNTRLGILLDGWEESDEQLG